MKAGKAVAGRWDPTGMPRKRATSVFLACLLEPTSESVRLRGQCLDELD